MAEKIDKIISRSKTLSLERPLIMGVLNVTPDSFSGGGIYSDPNRAIEKAIQMTHEGADIIDIGGESTGPGSLDVTVKEELERIIPVIRGIWGKVGLWISVDTYKAEVARQALDLGVDMINDVTALRGDEEMVHVLSKYDVPVVIMYSKDSTPRTTRRDVQYDDVVHTIKSFLEERISFGESNGVDSGRFIIDPGMGAFVSTDAKYSLQILKSLRDFSDLRLPVLVGPSRKSFIGEVLGLPVEDRLEGTLAACAVAVKNGASILRVHDVKETRRLVDMIYAIYNS
jgi:dihydropteroate synthase